VQDFYLLACVSAFSHLANFELGVSRSQPLDEKMLFKVKEEERKNSL
jgi:hypothetical protein